MLDVELDFRREAGEAPTADEYHRRFSEHPQLIADAFVDLLSKVDPDATGTYVVAKSGGVPDPCLNRKETSNDGLRSPRRRCSNKAATF